MDNFKYYLSGFKIIYSNPALYLHIKYQCIHFDNQCQPPSIPKILAKALIYHFLQNKANENILHFISQRLIV